MAVKRGCIGAGCVHARHRSVGPACAAHRSAPPAAASADGDPASEELQRQRAGVQAAWQEAVQHAKDANAVVSVLLAGWKPASLLTLLQAELSPQQRELVSTFARQHAAIALRPLLQVGATPGGVAHAADARCFLAWHRLQQHGRASRCVPVPGCCAACMACLQSEEPNQSINYI